MIITLNYSEFYNDVCESIRSFYPDAQITLGDNGDIIIEAVINGDVASSVASSSINGPDISQNACIGIADESDLMTKRALKRAIKLSVYKLLVAINGRTQPWGSLTGIRPTKMIYDGNITYKELNTLYGVSASKCQLLERIISNQKDYISPPSGSFDIYIGIPFCRTRCVYCSFATNDATKSKLIPQYMKALVTEIRQVSKFLNETGSRPRCLYIGGGTPTALDEYHLEVLLNECSAFLPTIEYTVEAGRPDTLNSNKLQMIKNAGVDRISINPQSMNQETLDLIGRKHSSSEIIECYKLAKDIGFDSINMDVIAGLPCEDVKMFSNTLDKLLTLDPDNLTVHTLSIKRGSYIAEHPNKYQMPTQNTVEAMVDSAFDKLTSSGYEPYYMYRQKYQNGNLENVGYCKKDKQCVYNIDIMEETTSIIALGAGAISKRVYSDESRIERCANSKSIYDYIDRVDEMIQRKIRLFDTQF